MGFVRIHLNMRVQKFIFQRNVLVAIPKGLYFHKKKKKKNPKKTFYMLYFWKFFLYPYVFTFNFFKILIKKFFALFSYLWRVTICCRHHVCPTNRWCSSIVLEVTICSLLHKIFLKWQKKSKQKFNSLVANSC